MKKLGFSVGVAALTAALVSGALALAEGPTRSEYVGRLEKICKPSAEATTRAMEGVRDDLRNHRLDAAAAKFEAARQIFHSTVATMSAVSRPSEDRDTLSEWFGYLKRQETYLRKIAEALRAGKAIKAQHLTTAFIRSGNRANDVTLAFGFNYCRFKFSRYS